MVFNTQTTLPILEKLIGFDTTSDLSNLALIEYVETYLDALGVAHERMQNADGTKSGLFATIGEGSGGIALSGHTDVVPVQDQQWDSDPFVLTERDGAFYGRGTCDMKSFLAIALAAVPEMQREALKRPFHLAFSYDEEIGCLAAAQVADFMIERNVNPQCVLVGEPTEMHVVDAHKGILSYETTVIGKESHSSQVHRGVNAIETMSKIINFLWEEAHALKDPTFCDSRFTPPYTTIHVGVIEGGVARNITPKHCRMLWEIRPLPGYDPKPLLKRFEQFCMTLEEKIRSIHAMSSISTRPVSSVFGMDSSVDDDTRQLFMKLAQTNAVHAVPYGTEGGMFQQKELPVLICGPGSIDQAHAPNEFITREQLDAGVAFMQRLIDWAR